MNANGSDPALAASLRALSAFSLQTRPAELHTEQVEHWARRVREEVIAAIAVFGASAISELIADFEAHCRLTLQECWRLVGGGAVGDFHFVRVFARQCASQRFPIEAALQAYRCMLPLLSSWLANEAVNPKARNRKQAHAALAEFATQYCGAVSIAFAGAYNTHSSVFADAEGDRRAELLGILVGGFDETDARMVRLLKRAGYLEQRLRFCVVLAQATDPLEMENSARVQRIADALVECVAPLSVRVLVGVRSNLVTAVFSDARRLSGWTAPQTNLADRVKERLLALGPAVLVGLSSEQASPSLVQRGLHEATVALDFASVGDRVVPFSALSIRRLLIHRGIEYVQSALPPWFSKLRDADVKSQGELVKTLRAFADADMNVQAAARRLHLHANTVYGRLQRIEELTGLSPQRYHDLTHLLLAADCGTL